jgi:uncharacterized protein (TIGR00369 family)
MMPPLERLQRLRTGELALPAVYTSLRISVVGAHRGRVRIALQPHECQANPHGLVAGGALVTALDTAAAWACETVDEQSRRAVTIELKTNFFRPVTLSQGVIAIAARVLFHGRRTAVALARAVDTERKLVHAVAIVTCAYADA